MNESKVTQTEQPQPKSAPVKQKPEPVKLVVSASPHIHTTKTTIESQMYTVVLALVPAGVMAVWLFGLPALMVTLLSVVFCLGAEAVGVKMFHPHTPTKPTLMDGSALITGILLAYNLPSSAPWWLILTGAIAAMILGKHVFGGLGQNPFNPALVARVFLLIAFPAQMASWPQAGENLWALSAIDTTTLATPLSMIKANPDGISAGLAEVARIRLWEIVWGSTGGSLGEVSVIALLLGAGFMWWRKVISWHIPVAYLGTVAVLATVFHLIDPNYYAPPSFHLVSGGLILGAFFMATDMVTSPLAPRGMLVFGAGCGLITYVIRAWGSYPEGVSFAILIMNAFVPLIDRYCQPRRFGKTTQ